MSVVTAYPTQNTIAPFLTFAWTNPTNAYAADGVFATASPSTDIRGSTYSFFGFESLIGSGSTINTVLIEAGYKVGNNTSDTLSLHGSMHSGSYFGTDLLDTSQPLSNTTKSQLTTGGITRSQLMDGNSFGIDVTCEDAGGGASAVFSLDFVRITVNFTLPTPVITSFSAAPPVIVKGASSVLSWTSTNGTSASLDNGIGAVATSGTHTVSPTVTTTYTLTATNADGSANSSTTVTVTPPSAMFMFFQD